MIRSPLNGSFLGCDMAGLDEGLGVNPYYQRYLERFCLKAVQGKIGKMAPALKKEVRDFQTALGSLGLFGVEINRIMELFPDVVVNTMQRGITVRAFCQVNLEGCELDSNAIVVLSCEVAAEDVTPLGVFLHSSSDDGTKQTCWRLCGDGNIRLLQTCCRLLLENRTWEKLLEDLRAKLEKIIDWFADKRAQEHGVNEGVA